MSEKREDGLEALREAVKNFLSARDALCGIPDGEAGDVEIGRRAEEASYLQSDMDSAIEDMRAAITEVPHG